MDSHRRGGEEDRGEGNTTENTTAIAGCYDLWFQGILQQDERHARVAATAPLMVAYEVVQRAKERVEAAQMGMQVARLALELELRYAALCEAYYAEREQ